MTKPLFGGAHDVVLRSGTRLRCGLRDGIPYADVALSAGGFRAVAFPSNPSGYGGAEMVVAPDERHAALAQLGSHRCARNRSYEQCSNGACVHNRASTTRVHRL